MKILLCNDDGIFAKPYRSLYAALLAAGHEVRAVAPAHERSGASASITTHNPLMVQEIHEPDFDGWAVHGTPADCALLGISGLFETSWKPDAIMSGINRGPSSGYDVLYSGTVGAALQGAMLGIPSMAVSSLRFSSDNREQAREAVSIMERLDFKTLPTNLVYNLNFPAHEVKDIMGMKICPLATWNPFAPLEERHTPDGRPYYWLTNLEEHFTKDAPGMDRGWLQRGYITLTPLRHDITDHLTMEQLRYLEKDKA